MYELKDLKHKLDELEVNWFETESGHIIIRACEVGDNFYDYGEEPAPIVFDKKYEFLENDCRVHILDCQGCCGCAGW